MKYRGHIEELHVGFYGMSRFFAALCNRLLFDMDSERFREIPLPDWLPKDTKFELGILSGCLCITHRDTIGSCFEAWAMKEYGVKES